MIGVDLVKINRFGKLKRADFKFWGKCFFESEWEYAFAKASPSRSLAGIFAAKEAVFKCSPSKQVKTIGDIEIRHDVSGAPYAKVLGRRGKVAVSISHEGGMAVAVAMI